MGRPTPTSTDLARGLVTGSFTAIGVSGDMEALNAFNVTVSGTFVGTVKLRRSFDGGTNWVNRGEYAYGIDYTFTTPASFLLMEAERGVLYSLECTAYTSGTINYRLSI